MLVELKTRGGGLSSPRAWAYALLSYRAHKRAHLDPEWAKRHVPWHYDHHMGPDQDANWCTLLPWFDDLMKTRRPYLGTERQRRDEERARERDEARARRAVAV